MTKHEVQIGSGPRNTPILVAGTTAQYRDLSRRLVVETDVVLEIGKLKGEENVLRGDAPF